MLAQTTIRVLTVDDSLVFKQLFHNNLPQINSSISIIGHALNAQDALSKIKTLQPDVITLDIEMPGMSGIELTKLVMKECPTPIILVSSLNISVFDALSYGAIDFVRKPDITNHDNSIKFLNTLARKIVIGYHSKKNIKTTSMTATQRLQRLSNTNTLSTLRTSTSLQSKVIAIGASTGGTEAILEVIKDLPLHTPGIVITQHMPAGFTKMYAERLNKICKISVKEAQNGDPIRPGTALLAPGGYQMKVVRNHMGLSVTCQRGANVSGHCPSVDVLFTSMAEQMKSDGIGIILTGMGRDGAAGMLKMHQAGAYTIGQNKESCVVYGMPMEAYKLGAVDVEAPCPQIPSVLLKRLNQGF